MNKYIEWGSFEGPDQPAQYANSQQVLDAGAYRLMDASMAVDELVTLATDYPQIRDFHNWAQFPGESVDRVRSAFSTWPITSFRRSPNVWPAVRSLRSPLCDETQRTAIC
jgi:hypothetical protein